MLILVLESQVMGERLNVWILSGEHLFFVNVLACFLIVLFVKLFAHLGIFFFLLPGVLAGNFFSILLENS